MTTYRLVERDLHTDQHLTIWDEVDGHAMTASQASALLIRVRAARPYLREPHCSSYLEVQPIPSDVLVAAALLLPDSPLLPAEVGP